MELDSRSPPLILAGEALGRRAWLGGRSTAPDEWVTTVRPETPRGPNGVGPLFWGAVLSARAVAALAVLAVAGQAGAREVPCPPAPGHTVIVDAEERFGLGPVHRLRVAMIGGRALFEAEEPFEVVCSAELLQIVPGAGSRLARLAIRFERHETWAAFLSEETEARAVALASQGPTESTLRALAALRASLEIAAGGGVWNARGAADEVALLSARLLDRAGRSTEAWELLRGCMGSSSECFAEASAFPGRHGGALRLEGLERVGRIPFDVPLSTSLEPVCEPLVFWSAEGLCVLQGAAAPFEKMRCCSPATSRWSRARPRVLPPRAAGCRVPEGPKGSGGSTAVLGRFACQLEGRRGGPAWLRCDDVTLSGRSTFVPLPQTLSSEVPPWDDLRIRLLGSDDGKSLALIVEGSAAWSSQGTVLDVPATPHGVWLARVELTASGPDGGR